MKQKNLFKQEIKSGIYMWTCKPTGDIYIGKAKDLYLRHRRFIAWNMKRKYAGRDVDRLRRMYPNIKFWDYKVLEYCPNDDDVLYDRERYWIAFYDSYNNGLNMTLGGETSKGCIMSDSCMSVLAYTVDGQFVKEYFSMSEAARQTNSDVRNIHRACHKGLLCAGFQWRIKSGNEIPLKIDRRIIINSKSKPVIAYKLDGSFYKVFKYIGDALDEVDGKVGCEIYKCCRGELQSAYGMQWRFYTDNYPLNIDPWVDTRNDKVKKKIIAYNLDGTFYKVFESHLDAVKCLGVGTTRISNCVAKRQVVSGNYMFRDYTDNFPMKIEPYVEKHSGRKKPLKVYKDGQFIGQFPTGRAAAKALDIDFRKISIIVRKGENYNGIEIKYA